MKELECDVEAAAKRLLGAIIEREIDGHLVTGKIVEVEAYDQTDAASHSHKGRTPRNEVMFWPAGYLYVYFTYGMHYCCNVVTGKAGEGSAVLIRAIEPVKGIEIMAQKRGKTGRRMTNGPAKACQALDIDKRLNGHDLRCPPVKLCLLQPLDPFEIITSTRIGIKQAMDMQRRFYIKDNPYVSVV